MKLAWTVRFDPNEHLTAWVLLLSDFTDPDALTARSDGSHSGLIQNIFLYWVVPYIQITLKQIWCTEWMKSVKHVNTNISMWRIMFWGAGGVALVRMGWSQCLLSLLAGGNTSIENNPKHDGDDGTSFLGPEGEPFLYPLKGNVTGSWVCSQHLQSANLYSAFDTFAVFVGASYCDWTSLYDEENTFHYWHLEFVFCCGACGLLSTAHAFTARN